MNSTNGILASVPGEFMAQALNKLPAAETAKFDQASATVEAAWLGLVRIYFERKQLRHNKYRWWAWVAWFAEAVAPSSDF